MSFYTYHQNNSGGGFDSDDDAGISTVVVVEAHGPNHADERAEAIGLYFDGVYKGFDCECCGDRWYRAWEDGTAHPEHYGRELTLIEDGSVVYVHPLEGEFYKMYTAA